MIKPLVIAIDLDGTLAEFSAIAGGNIQAPRPDSQRVVRALRDAGHYLLIHSVRTEEFTIRDWTRRHYPGCFSGINCNPRDAAEYGIVSAKPLADVYVDDKAYPLCVDVNWLEFEAWCKERGIL